MRERLNQFDDFTSQVTILEEFVRSKGHICLYLPKYHCELNPIYRKKLVSRKKSVETVCKWFFSSFKTSCLHIFGIRNSRNDEHIFLNML